MELGGGLTELVYGGLGDLQILSRYLEQWSTTGLSLRERQ